jgi:geranylgeranyl reductase family protein
VRSVDVAVIGGGPAGAAAAITLARAGRTVTLVDKATFPRDKFCGDGLTTAALRAYESLGLDPGDVPSWTVVDEFALRSPSGRWIDLALPDGDMYAAVARRVDLDAAFLDRARVEGADVQEGRALTGAELRADRVVLEIEGSADLTARYVIGADGMWSPLRKFIGRSEPGYLGEWHAFRQYFEGVSPEASRRLVIWFEPDILPGYAWSFPLGGGRANVGFGVIRGGKAEVRDMKRLWPDILARSHVREVLGPDARPEGPHRAWPIPAHIDRSVLASGRALWVGDAAAAVDPMSGEGIAQALETGRWAAEAIVAAGPYDPPGVRRRYERAARRGLVADHRMSVLLLRALQHRKGVRIPLWLVDANDWTRRNFARWLWEDYPRALLATPRRWHRHMFTGPGAYPEHSSAR